MKKKIVIIALVIITAAVAIFIFGRVCTNKVKFNGSSVKTADAYLLDIQKMNGSDSHVLELSEGDSLQIKFEKTSGSLTLEIKMPDETTLYSGNGNGVTDFEVNIPKSGEYSILVEGENAKGTIHVNRK